MGMWLLPMLVKGTTAESHKHYVAHFTNID